MRIDILCSSAEHPINARLHVWAREHGARIFRSAADLTGGDFLFLISCSEIVAKKHRDRYRHALVIHASDLPRGRGWSPYVWEVLNGTEIITVSLLDAECPLDSGDVWRKVRFVLDGTELVDEINAKLFAAEVELMDWALVHCDSTLPVPQVGEPAYWPKRTPEDSRVSADQTLAEIFDLLRVCDPERYPAFLEHRGAKYAVALRRI